VNATGVRFGKIHYFQAFPLRKVGTKATNTTHF
jgi:hypothetical protein